MALLTWEEQYSVNVREIDDQHKRLFNLINDLHMAMLVGRGKDVAENVLKSLTDYAAYHFSTEEKHMARLGYPGFEAHKAQHDDFVRRVTEFQASFEAGKTPVTLDMIRFLNGWVTGHIKGSDRKYTPFFNEHGLK